MDKGKNRKDLLKAGREKLQQFRKTSKGGSSKSSKAGKSRAATEDTVSLSGSNTRIDPVGSDAVASTDAISVGAITSVEIASPEASVQFPSEDSGMDETRLNPDDGHKLDHGVQERDGLLLVLEDEIDNMPDTSNPTNSIEKSNKSIPPLPIDISPQPEIQHVEEQVTDIGATQEAGSSSLNQIDEGGGAEIEGPGALSNELNQTEGDHITNNSSNTQPEKSADASAHLSKSHNALSIDVAINDAEEAQESHILLNETETGHLIKVESTDQQNEGIPVLSNVEKVDPLCISGDNGDGSVEVTPARFGVIGEDRSLELHIDETKSSFGCRQVDLSSVLDGSLIKLSQLAEILDGDEMEFLRQSRKSPVKKFQDTDEMKNIKSFSHDDVEWLKEQLYVATISKDAFCLELSEHQNLIDEILITNASLDEVQKNNKILTEEIVQCRYEIQEVVSVRLELEKQLQVSNDEIKDFSSKINELQHKLETTQTEMSTVMSELVDCRNLVEALQAEKESLNGSFHLVTEEKEKLFQESEIVLLENLKMKGELAQLKAFIEELQMQQVVLTDSLTSARDGMKQLEKEKEHVVHEKSAFIADMEEYKSSVEVLRVENQSLNESLSALSEEKEKLGEEKETVVHQAEKFSNDLMDCKQLVSTLEMEISNLKESLNCITEERKKVEEEREKMFLEYEKQSQELAEIKVSEADLRAECSKVVNDLKEATFQVNQLADENEALKTNSEFYKSNIKRVDQENFSARDVANNSGESEAQTHMKPEPDSSSRDPLQLDVYDDSIGFLALKRHLEEAGTIMLNLEKAIESMHSYSNSLSRSIGKTVAPGVSKLIQAFESKVVTDDPETVESPISGNQTSGDPYVMTKLVTKDLEALMMDIVRDADKASEFCKEILQNKLFADAAGAELRSSYDALSEHTDQVEGSNIELMVLYEAMKQNLNHAVAKEDALRILCDLVQKQEHILKSENTQLTEKLNDFEVKVTVLQSQLNGICKSSEDTVASLSDQLKILQEEVSNRQSGLEEEWESIVTQILQIAGELDAAVESSNSSAGTTDNRDVVTCVASSVVRATKVIEDLQRQLEATRIDHESASGAYNDMMEKSSNLQAKNEMASNTLNILHNKLHELVSETLNCSDEIENVLVENSSQDLLHLDGFKPLLDQLKNFLDEKMQIKSTNKQLNTELMNKTRHIDALEKQCLEVDTITKLADDIEQSLRKDGVEIDTCEPVHRIESVINLLFEKYNVAGQSLSSSTLLGRQVTELQGQVEHLNATLVECENENLVFKQSLKSAEEYAVSLNSILQEKVAELEQSEQRVASLREKLSIAVTKGKGLISQRDNLKQSLAEMSKELEKSSQELLSKDASLHELESKLEVYAEAGERMEALESELSYIRNSATALRESFLLKDSALQRIEEILEDLELPEHLYSRDIIEKIDWLMKSVTRTSLPHNEWDHRSSEGVGSHSDSGTLGVSEVREEMKPNPNSTEDLSMRYEELQSKFYELAEQNEMLEQSLMERNNHIQHWEEILDRIDIPSQLRSLEPEDKIQWLESALAEAQNQCSSLQQKIDNLENTCGSQSASLEDSQRRISEIDTAFQQAIMEKETLSRDLDLLRHDNDEISRKTADVIVSNEKLQDEVSGLLEQRLRMEEDIRHTEAAVRRLQELVMNALQFSTTEDVVFDHNSINHLEVMLSLVEKYEALSSMKHLDIDPVDVSISGTGEVSHISRDGEEMELETLRKRLEDCMGELMIVKEEKDSYMLKNQSLLSEIETLDVRKNELQELLNQEEQKSASVREKLNMAVRKGKSLVQQRDGMKQVIEELNAEVGRLKSETKITEKAIFEYEETIKELSTFKERAQVLESETVLLRGRLAENEWTLHEKEVIWSSMLDALGDIDVGVALDSGDPVEKVKELGKYLRDLCVNLNSAEQETRKSKRASELLLAELNEVQERNDGLQEELIKVSHLLSEVSREKDLAETAKSEILAHVETLSIRSEEKDRQLSELMVLKSGVDQIREELLYTETELGDVFSTNVEVLHSLEAMMKSFLEPRGKLIPFSHGFTGPVKSINSESKVFLVEIGSFREQLYKHSRLLHEEASRVAEVVFNVHREYVSQKEKHESVMSDIKRLKFIEKEKESELQDLRGSISLLYDACTNIISEIENWKSQVLGNALLSKFPESYSRSQLSIEEGNGLTNDMHVVNQEQIRGMRAKLILLVKDFMNMQSELMEDGQREMKSTLLNLRKELQQKDVQRDRICTELINQIKEAETTANNYRHEVQQVRTEISDLQSQVAVMEEEREVLEQRMRELKHQETNVTNLQQKINSLTNVVAAKEQENEALMQALDEDETQMEDLKNRIGMLENELLQKNQEIENVEASRSKALKKHAVAVSKFDEVHNFSKNLVSEVEMLQSQLQERDGEISFLRQEVTRCTNDVLAVTQMSKKKSSDELLNVLMWFDSLLSRVKDQAVTSEYKEDQVNECKEILQRQIMSLVSELENLRSVAQNSDMLLQQERTKLEEFEQKEQLLKNSLRAKESQILALQGSSDFVIPTNSTSEIVEVDQMKNNWAPPGTSTQQVRSLRKANNDQVAIAIDDDKNSDLLEDDDDKAHGFKSLTTSKIVPRFTRPISDMVDGLWVSCDRALMRQPALRLGVIIYWAILHTLLAVFVV